MASPRLATSSRGRAVPLPVTRALGRSALGFILLFVGVQESHSASKPGPKTGFVEVSAHGAPATGSSQAWRPKKRARKGHVGSWVEVGGSVFMIWGAQKTSVMPKSAEVTPDGEHVLVAHIGRKHQKNIGVYQAIPLKFERWIDYEGSAIELAFSPDARTLYATNMHKFGFLDVLDRESFEHKRHLRVHGFPKVIVPDTDGRFLYLSMWSDNGVARVDTQSWDVKYLVTEGRSRFRRRGSVRSKTPRGMALTADGQTLYVANNADRSMTLIDIPTFKDRKHFDIGPAPRHVIRSRDDRSMFVSLSGSNSVAQIDVTSEKVVAQHKVGHRPKGIAQSFDGRFLYSADYVGHSLTIVELETGDRATLPLNVLKTSGIGVHPSDGFIYITGWCTYDIWAIQRIDPGDAPLLPLGWNKPNAPCYDCPSTYMACPKQVHRR